MLQVLRAIKQRYRRTKINKSTKVSKRKTTKIIMMANRTKMSLNQTKKKNLIILSAIQNT